MDHIPSAGARRFEDMSGGSCGANRALLILDRCIRQDGGVRIGYSF
jgi:hypothetical protein